MEGLRLTDRLVASLSCPSGRQDALFFDSAEPGFGVRVTANGKRVFLFQYRYGTAVRRIRIGVWGEGRLTTTSARNAAERLRGLVQSGQDPVAERKAAHAAAAAREAENAFTFFALIDSWLEGIAHRRPRYRQDAEGRLKNYFADWRARPASSLKKAEVVHALDRIAQQRGITSARRALAYGRAAYSWACKRDTLQFNPFQGVAGPGQEVARDRVLDGEELGAVWRAAARLSNPIHTAYVRLLLLTLQRREEIGSLQWQEVAPDLASLTVPASRAKNGRAHFVYLPPAARDILRGIPRFEGSAFVFPGRTPDGPITTYPAIKAGLDAAIRTKRESLGLPDIPHWQFHDFRRSGVTALADLGVAPHVADRLLNHVSGTLRGVAAVYQRSEFLAERERALTLWAVHVLSCAEGRERAADVIPLKRAGRHR
jgi:integrase